MFELVRRLLVAGIALGVIAGNADEIQRFYDDTVAASQSLATAADLRSISTMLDYEYMKRGRYPATDGFLDWMKTAFKENPAGEPGVDHWGNPLVYRATGNRKGYRLVSAGPDGFVGTDDDLTYTGP
jgi:general secretion pathway protein G